MAVIAPTPITALPTPPTTADPTNFDARADALLAALPTLVTQENALGDNVYNNATEAFNAGVLAQIAANFKGQWSSLTGALSVPATVYHSNTYWVLLSNLANVTTATPGVSGSWVAATVQLSSLEALRSINGGALSGLRNRLINGGMLIDQRNDGASQTFTAAAALAYSVDRWYGYCTGANVTGQRVAGSGTTYKRYQFTGAASITKIGFAQRIEQANSWDLNGRTCTLGVDLANSLLTTVTWVAYYANTADTFGTLAAPTRTQIATGTFTVNSTVTRYYAQIAVPAAATTGIEIELSVAAQTSGTWTIGEAQFVPGSANELWREHRPIGVELALCQRYFETLGMVFTDAATTNFPTGYWKAVKRVSPTLAILFNGSSGAGIVVLSQDTTSGFYQNANNAISSNARVSGSSEL